MVITAMYDHEARKKSYQLLADAFGLARRRRPSPGLVAFGTRPGPIPFGKLGVGGRPQQRAAVVIRRPGLRRGDDLILPAERGPERMPGIHADYAKFAREEFQLLDREGQAACHRGSRRYRRRTAWRRSLPSTM